MPLNKYSSPEEVIAHHENWDKSVALKWHITTFYPNEQVTSGLQISTLEKIIRTLSTKAMEVV